MDGVVALDVERPHDLVGELHGAVHALVAEPAAQLVYGEVEPLMLEDDLGVTEEVCLERLPHGHEVRSPHMYRTDGMRLVEGLVLADKVQNGIALRLACYFQLQQKQSSDLVGLPCGLGSKGYLCLN